MNFANSSIFIVKELLQYNIVTTLVQQNNYKMAKTTILLTDKSEEILANLKAKALQDGVPLSDISNKEKLVNYALNLFDEKLSK